MAGIDMFTQAHDGRLPEALTWADNLQLYVKNRQAFKCLDDRTDQAVSYAMVQRYSGAKLDDIPSRSETILIYEVENGQPAYRHLGGMNVAYADGHREWLEQLPPGTLDE